MMPIEVSQVLVTWSNPPATVSSSIAGTGPPAKFNASISGLADGDFGYRNLRASP
jgi:hypothetical protein